ncbi:MAG: hypothetical protein MASP_00921 [Candidatus Methanolliviera sp. GoM_asphalt]|nr:MAG: hypothetical protein MASP_00921 [Candidatus Methanolliviera sp. GoM_asphalt]
MKRLEGMLKDEGAYKCWDCCIDICSGAFDIFSWVSGK